MKMRRNIVIRNINETLYKKLRKKKVENGFKEKSWREWLAFLVRDVRLVDRVADQIMKNTGKTLRALWMRNFGDNLPLIKKNCLTLRDLATDNPDGSAIVVGAGPSIWNHNHLELLAKSGYDGCIIACDKMLVPLLKHEIIPEVVVSVDGHPTLVAKFYDHPLVRKYGSKIKVVLHGTVAKNVPEACKRAKMPIHWFLGISDACTENSTTVAMLWMTASKRNPTGIVSMTSGGNTGTASWVLAWHVLKKNPVALVGFDFGYPEGTPLTETPYYSTFMDLDPDPTIAALKAQQYYEQFYHPVFKTKVLMCPVFKAYRQYFYELLDMTPPQLTTVNCTEGGSLYHRRLKYMKFKDFLIKRKVNPISKHPLHSHN